MTNRIFPGITESDLLSCLPGTPKEIVARLRERTSDPERFMWAHVNPNLVNAALSRTKAATFSMSEPIVSERGITVGRERTWRVR